MNALDFLTPTNLFADPKRVDEVDEPDTRDLEEKRQTEQVALPPQPETIPVDKDLETLHRETGKLLQKEIDPVKHFKALQQASMNTPHTTNQLINLHGSDRSRHAEAYTRDALNQLSAENAILQEAQKKAELINDRMLEIANQMRKKRERLQTMERLDNLLHEDQYNVESMDFLKEDEGVQRLIAKATSENKQGEQDLIWDIKEKKLGWTNRHERNRILNKIRFAKKTLGDREEDLLNLRKVLNEHSIAMKTWSIILQRLHQIQSGIIRRAEGR